MRHNKKINHLGRTSSHRHALLSNMACSLILHKRIQTTLAKAKALKVYVEPLLTKAKNDTTHSRRTVFSYLRRKEVVAEMFGDVAQKIANRPGGYTRILKLGNRLGDNAEMCIIELVDYNTTYTEVKKEEAKKTLNKELEITSEGLAVIPTEFKTEILCWEFKGKVDGTDFLVYINAENGREEDILIITNTPKASSKLITSKVDFLPIKRSILLALSLKNPVIFKISFVIGVINILSKNVPI